MCFFQVKWTINGPFGFVKILNLFIYMFFILFIYLHHRINYPVLYLFEACCSLSLLPVRN
jgi:hypothetical protein